MQGSDLSRQFFEEWILPLVREYDSALEGELAAGVLGMGSDVSGLDDELSREHHWGPRCNLLLPDGMGERCAGLEAFLQREVGSEFLGYRIYHNPHNRCGVSVETVSGFFRELVGRERAPERPEEWLALTKADLFHVTRGQVFHDGPGELTRRREAFAYFPEPVRRKKIADWLVFLTGHGVYNINRARLRQDWATATIYLGVAIKRILELGHLLNRTYAPYNKWLYRSFRRLPILSEEVVPLIDGVLATGDWEEKCRGLLRVTVLINDELERQGLAQRQYPASGEPAVTEAWLYPLYDAAVEIYRTLPDALVWGRPSEIEQWETVVKKVLLDPEWKAGFPDLQGEGS